MKKFISVLLSICLIVGALFSVGFNAFALTEYVENDINPLFDEYETVTKNESERELPYRLKSTVQTVKGEYIYKDFKSLSMFIRDCMVKRVPRVIYCVSKNATDNLENVYNKDSGNFYYPLYGAMSYEISSSSKDGDYLFHSYSSSKDNSKKDMGEYYLCTLNIFYRTTLEEENTVDSYVSKTVNSIKSNYSERLDMIKAVHDEICSLVDYDEENYESGYSYSSNINTAYSGVATGLTMCTGYSMLFYRLCRELDIPVRIVASKTHAWNIVKPVIGKYYYNIDVTWDDSYSFPDENAPYGCDFYLKNDNEVINKKSHRGYLDKDNDDHERIKYYSSEYFKTHYPVPEASFYCDSDSSAVCAYCKNIVEDETPTALDHTYTSSVTAASCLTDGKTVYNCSHCGDSFSERIPALGHSIKKAGVVAPKCTVKGTEKYKCSRCSFGYETEIPALKHRFSDNSKYCKNNCGKINPAYVFPSTVLKKPKLKKRSLTLKWKKISAVNGYQIQYSTSKKFKKKSTKTLNIKNSKTVSKKLKLKGKKKKYYIRIRTYKKLGGKTVYSKWSKVKTVKLK